MKYEINTPEFEGPMDLLLHLIKQDNIDIKDVSIDKITKQYLEYINKMQEMNLNVASEYLVMASELIEIKSSSLLPKQEATEDEFESDPKEKLIEKLLEYEQYKNITDTFKELEEYRKDVYTKYPSNLLEYQTNNSPVDYGVDISDLLNAFSNLLEEKELEKPLDTKISTKEYSVTKRSIEIKNLLKQKKTIEFKDLFDSHVKEYIVVTFLAILSMSKKQEIEILQEGNFNNILIKGRSE